MTTDAAPDTSHQDTLGRKLFQLGIGRLSDEHLDGFLQLLTVERIRRAGGAPAEPALPEPGVGTAGLGEAGAAGLEECLACHAPGDPTRAHKLGTAQHPLPPE